jgi:hypothetical protein
MTTATQTKPNPVPAILVYGTPSGPALTLGSEPKTRRPSRPPRRR